MIKSFNRIYLPLLFLILTAVNFFFSPFIAASPNKAFKIGIIQLPAPYAVEIEEGLRKRLDYLGYKIGDNLTYELKIGEPEEVNYDKNIKIAKELIANDADLIITIGTGASTPVWPVVKEAKIPMAFVGVTYPIEGGLIKVFGKPTGTNITGISYGVPPSTRLRIFRQIFPDSIKYKNLGFAYSGVMEQEITYVKELRSLSETYGFNLKYVNFYNYDTKKPDFNILESSLNKLDVVFGWYTLDNISADSLLFSRLTSSSVPILGITSRFTDLGAIGGVLTDHYALGAQHADLAAQILSGINPGEIPPVQPSGYLIEINLKKARELGIEIPLEIVGAASRIVTK
ncbi:MAG: ABC transporter substrate-binding protein [candidate division Zixibacteria bacterium]|nr:ABC transporter substrate-binding protein [candidate division Zixibacteria bacterium]